MTVVRLKDLEQKGFNFIDGETMVSSEIQGEMINFLKIQLAKNISHSLLVILCFSSLFGKLTSMKETFW